MKFFAFIVILVNILHAQMALPTFHGVHKSHSTSTSSDNGPSVANGYMHSIVILENGTVKAFGRSNYGQLGQENTTQIGDNANEMGDNLAAVDLGSGRTAIAVAAGVYHSVAVLDNGTVKAWGYNNYGQLGQGNNTSTIGNTDNQMGDNLAAIDLGSGRTATAIAAGYYHTVALLDNGTVKAWGYNNYGQLGRGNRANIGDAPNEMGDNLAAIDLGSGRTATAIAAGLYSTAAVLDDGTVKIWGYNSQGQLGQGNTSTIGDAANEMGDNLAAIDLGSGRTATDVSIGYLNSMVLLDNGTIKVWGGGSIGYNGQGNTANIGDNANEMGDNLAAIDLGSGRTAVKIFAGYRHCAALLDNGTVKAWGYNNNGQLGQGNRTNIGDNANEMGDNLAAIDLGTSRTATDITVGIYHMSAVLDNGTVKIWGYNSHGQLGQGNTSTIGDAANEMGDNLSNIDLSSSSDKVLQ